MEKVTYTKDIGIDGIDPPTKTCNDKKCAWHGTVRIRGRIFVGKIVKKSFRSALVEFYRYIYINKYERYEIRRSRIRAHLPPCIEADIGDTVVIGETRPLSKSISFVVIGKK